MERSQYEKEFTNSDKYENVQKWTTRCIKAKVWEIDPLCNDIAFKDSQQLKQPYLYNLVLRVVFSNLLLQPTKLNVGFQKKYGETSEYIRGK